MVRKYEEFNEQGQLISICKRPAGVEIDRMGYVAHLLLSVKKGWAHADNLAFRLWKIRTVESLKQYQLTAVINELRAQVKDIGGLL
jgi:hypothetical protein